MILSVNHCLHHVNFYASAYFRYLIEFNVKNDKAASFTERYIAKDEGIVADVDDSVDTDVSLEDVKEVLDPIEKVVPGLQTNGDVQIPLKSVHIRGKLVDLAAEIVVFQEYINEGTESIEAKYVFPLNEMAAVCGFEAFINDKHIVGEVKEKEQAHREYKEAISKGHGAYLMDEEEPDVFTVSVGNLPALARVLIKITYVAELALEGELINLFIPGSVAPWRRDSALENITQSDVKRVDVLCNEESFSLQIAVEMPFKIRELRSPTHELMIKKTDTKAVVKLETGVGLNEGFQLLIGLAEIHVPRMWTEENPNEPQDQACMLTFFPEFDDCTDQEVEVIILLDSSNSMASSCQNLKKAALLSLLLLPENCRFNVISFGSNYHQLFPKCQPRTASNLSEATLFIKKVKANKGGTDLWRIMKKMQLLANYERPHPLNVFLFSDGHITEEVITMVTLRNSAKAMRLFTFGFGSTANRHLLTKLAEVGAGAAEFLDSKRKSQWEKKIKEQLRKAQQPALSSVKVIWHQYDNDAPKPLQVIFQTFETEGIFLLLFWPERTASYTL